jgi:hypothetical protein
MPSTVFFDLPAEKTGKLKVSGLGVKTISYISNG